MVSIEDDGLLEGEEQFLGLLSQNPGGRMVTLGVRSATATIEDDDGE